MMVKHVCQQNTCFCAQYLDGLKDIKDNIKNRHFFFNLQILYYIIRKIKAILCYFMLSGPKVFLQTLKL